MSRKLRLLSNDPKDDDYWEFQKTTTTRKVSRTSKIEMLRELPVAKADLEKVPEDSVVRKDFVVGSKMMQNWEKTFLGSTKRTRQRCWPT